ncbi:MAG: hypothetical protein KDD56_09645, partial [Bdellovibrionales bacterium]|nr:hypothetical protein [Bdellovibrionales bacterium]
MRELLIVNNLKEAKFHGKQALGFERRFRLPAVLGAIRNSRLAVVNLSAPEADIKDLLEVHTREYLQKLRLVVEKSKETGKPQEFGDEVLIYPGTYAAASTAAGAGILAVNSIIEGSLDRAFIAVRSAGHHAEPEKAMGYCIFSNAAIAALYAYKKFAKKTAVVDLDIHSGNGTAKSLANREGVSFYELFLENDIESYPSPEQMPNLKAGNIVQVGLPSGTTGQEWLRVLKEKI